MILPILTIQGKLVDFLPHPFQIRLLLRLSRYWNIKNLIIYIICTTLRV